MDSQNKDLTTIEHILEALLPPHHAENDYVDDDLFEILPIVESPKPLPFYTDDAKDKVTPFNEPMDKEAFEHQFAEIFGKDGQDFSWYEHSELSYTPMWAENVERSLEVTLNYRPEDSLYNELPSILDRSAWKFEPLLFKGYPDGVLCGYAKGVTDWSTVIMLIARRPNTSPHVSCVLVHSLVGPKVMTHQILRSELICILSIIRHRMRRREWRAHKIFPVSVYTLTGQHIRITQAYFEHGKLLLHRTEPLEIPVTKDKSAQKMFLRWILSKPLDSIPKAKVVEQTTVHETSPRPALLPPLVQSPGRRDSQSPLRGQGKPPNVSTN
ncbi:Hypothetical protein R9X50_00464400 [Acrodontium crateriforme]|uniref:Uncharacterized protein n=1 Tax=Acrodontium crateriforme TaxID=150365 RepID=A0AAQ3R586_9PEZI|nr:Hypothetical protein R9X50_00464400 [Acrodontium crateriforme]